MYPPPRRRGCASTQRGTPARRPSTQGRRLWRQPRPAARGACPRCCCCAALAPCGALGGPKGCVCAGSHKPCAVWPLAGEPQGAGGGHRGAEGQDLGQQVKDRGLLVCVCVNTRSRFRAATLAMSSPPLLRRLLFVFARRHCTPGRWTPARAAHTHQSGPHAHAQAHAHPRGQDTRLGGGDAVPQRQHVFLDGLQAGARVVIIPGQQVVGLL